MANPNIWAPGESISANSSVAVERFVATAGQTLFTLTAFTYSVGTSSLYVYVNGGFQVVAVDFTETSSSSFTLSEAVTEGSIVAAVGFLEIAGGSSVVDAAVVAAQAAQVAAELAASSLGDVVAEASGYADAAAASVASIETAIALKVDKTSDTGSAQLPVGNTSQRDGDVGSIRYNSETDSFEGKSAGGYGSLGGAAGGSGNPFCYENDITVSADYTITSGKNAISAGPITINDGVTVTIPDGSTWSIV